MKKQIVVLVSLVVMLGLVACGSLQTEKRNKTNAHASLTEQQKLISCSDCHKDATPKIYSQWFDSTHGLGGVKCYQCHNTFGDIRTQPDINQSCNSCHADMVGNTEHTEGLATCWECHTAHDFSAGE